VATPAPSARRLHRGSKLKQTENKRCGACYEVQPLFACFCNHCGEKFDFNPQQAPQRTQPKSHLLSYAFGIVVLFVGTIALAALLSPRPEVAGPAPPPSSTPVEAEVISWTEPVADLKGRVVGIADGDTLTILDDLNQQHKIRLAGIDAPESGQDFGNKSKQNLSSLVYGKTVTVFGSKIDKYGRRVGKIAVGGMDVNLEQVKAGLAWHYKEYAVEQSESDRTAYAEAEAAARKGKFAIWSLPNPVAPWDYRHGITTDPELKDKIFGNTNSMLYHWSGCPGFLKIAEKNRVVFESWEEAEAEGYTAANNCTSPKPKSTRDDTDPTSVEGNDSVEVPAFPKPAELPYYVPPKTAPTPEYAGPNVRTYEAQRSEMKLATGACSDGMFTYSDDRATACTGHGEVTVWFGNTAVSADEDPPSPNNYYPRNPSYPSRSSGGDATPSTGSQYVNGYTRKDGTYVRGYNRTTRNSTTLDNYSTKGNVNPFTGKRGTKRP
jgi:endonuclease YncB( thermonuclease family)